MSIFGLPLKTLLFVTVLIGLLVVDGNWDQIRGFGDRIVDTVSGGPNQAVTDSVTTSRDIVADREDVREITSRLLTAKLEEIEKNAGPEPEGKTLYIITLRSGAVIKSFNVTVKPDEVVLLSPAGVSTTIPLPLIAGMKHVVLPADRQ